MPDGLGHPETPIVTDPDGSRSTGVGGGAMAGAEVSEIPVADGGLQEDSAHNYPEGNGDKIVPKTKEELKKLIDEILAEADTADLSSLPNGLGLVQTFDNRDGVLRARYTSEPEDEFLTAADTERVRQAIYGHFGTHAPDIDSLLWKEKGDIPEGYNRLAVFTPTNQPGLYVLERIQRRESELKERLNHDDTNPQNKDSVIGVILNPAKELLDRKGSVVLGVDVRTPMAINVMPLDETRPDLVGPGWNAPSNEIPAMSADSPDLVTDVNQAYAMAKAGDEARTRAASLRAAGRHFELLPEGYSSIDAKLEHHNNEVPINQSLFFNKRHKKELARHQQRARDLEEEIIRNRARLDETTNAILEKAGFGPISLVDRAKSYYDVSDTARDAYDKEKNHLFFLRAAEKDNEARQREEIAGILHKHSPSKEYVKANPLDEVDYTTVDGLLRLKEKIIPDQEAELERLWGLYPYSPSLDDLLADLDQLRGFLSKQDMRAPEMQNLQAIADELSILNDEETATLAEIRKLGPRIPVLWTRIAEIRLAYIKRVFDDIKSGRAAETSSSQSTPSPGATPAIS